MNLLKPTAIADDTAYTAEDVRDLFVWPLQERRRHPGRVKGLEFPCVLIAGVQAGSVPPRAQELRR